MLSAARLMAAWSLDRSTPPHWRLARLVRAMDDTRSCGDDTLGDRNRRLLRLHCALSRGPLEACVKCSVCGVDNELTVPVKVILETPATPRDARVRLRLGRSMGIYRLPRMTDIEAAAESDDVPAAVLERCRVEGRAGPLHEHAMLRLGRRFEVIDPLSNIVVNMTCSGCGTALAASVEIAALVAHEIDAIVEGLYRDIDCLASAYGWSEQSILALPAERRQRYVALRDAAPPRTRL
ncbi:hypothetical protein [Paraburkholderia caribensis]|uniref:hypothetical protein n=1 Tax=Paraburkholderia caribensis TaxID=75105 RepID=UPI001D07B488|nr:hypothetical protein [Paraburkholderia caribensis]